MFTIHNLMNAMNVNADVIIEVFESYRFEHCYYIGKYEDCNEYIYNMNVDNFVVRETRENLYGDLRITKVTIYVENFDF